MNSENLINILFRFYSNMLDEETTEILKAEIINEDYGYFKITGIPFYAPKIAAGDVVWAEYNAREGMLTYRKTIEASGNSTIHVILLNAGGDSNDLQQIFDNMGCKCERLNEKYFAINIPAQLDYITIKRQLDELEKGKVLDYAESGLSEKHQYKNTSFKV